MSGKRGECFQIGNANTPEEVMQEHINRRITTPIPHTEPGCGGLWRGDRETGVIRCTLCGAEHPGTKENISYAISANSRTMRQEGTNDGR